MVAFFVLFQKVCEVGELNRCLDDSFRVVVGVIKTLADSRMLRIDSTNFRAGFLQLQNLVLGEKL